MEKNNNKNIERKQTNIYWFSTRRLNNFQFDSLKKKYGFINVKLCGKIIENFSEIESDIRSSDVIVTATHKYEREIYSICAEIGKPFMRWRANDTKDKNSDGAWEDITIREQKIFENNNGNNSSGIIKKIFTGFGYLLSSFTTKKGIR